ncbi:hypothetical protein GCM10027284_44240 [Cyclobacterium sediminis]
MHSNVNSIGVFIIYLCCEGIFALFLFGYSKQLCLTIVEYILNTNKMKLSFKYIAIILFFCILSFNESLFNTGSRSDEKIEKIENLFVQAQTLLVDQVKFDLK